MPKSFYLFVIFSTRKIFLKQNFDKLFLEQSLNSISIVKIYENQNV
jgi:hypothetical protein